MSSPKFNSIYGERVRPTLKTGEVGARQCFKAECDVNNIVARFVREGGIPEQPKQVFIDTTRIPDFQSMRDVLAQIHSDFELQPLETRQRFSDALEWAFADDQGSPRTSAEKASESLSEALSNDSGKAEPAEAQPPEAAE